MSPKSVAIIGAGFAGLSAGCYARMNGYDVDIYEQHTLPGGLCTAWERKGFTFDFCIEWLAGSDPHSSLGRLWNELGVLQGQQFIDSEVFTVYESADGRSLTAYTDPERLRAEMKRHSPADAAPIDAFCNAVQACRNLPMGEIKAPELTTFWDRLSMLKLMPRFLRLGKLMQLTVEEFSTRFSNPFLASAFKALFGLPGFPLAAVIVSYAWLPDHNAGYPIGGSMKLTGALTRRAENLGCRIHCGRRVEKVLVEQGRAVGLRLAGGEEVRADWVIAAGDLHSLVYDLLEGRFVDEEHRRYFEESGIFGPINFVSFGVRRTFDDLPKAVAGFQMELPERPTIGGAQLDRLRFRVFNFDPTMAPAGSSVVTCMLDAPYDHWKALSADRTRYLTAKREVADAVATLLERRFPGFKEQIEVVDVATPATVERYTSNWKGSYEGWLITTRNMQKQLKRTLPGLDGLYLIGQWVRPGGGLPTGGMHGRTIVQLLCHRDGKRFEAQEA